MVLVSRKQTNLAKALRLVTLRSLHDNHYCVEETAAVFFKPGRVVKSVVPIKTRHQFLLS